MPVDHNTPWFGVNDCKLRKVLTDPSVGSATYATRIDVPGIKSVAISGDVNSNELRGDGQRLDRQSVLGGLTLSFEFAKSALDVFALVAGGTVVDAGVTPNLTASWKLKGTDQMSTFEFEAQTTGTGGGDGHIILHKVVLTSFPELGMSEEDYQTYTVEAAAMVLASTGDLLTYVRNETAVAIPA